MATDKSTPIQPVVIIGAGPSGLLLARYLQIHQVPCVVYERESSPDARGQGGSLDLHDETGLKALRDTGLLEEARGMMRMEGEAMKIIDKTGKIWWDEEGGAGPHPDSAVSGRPEIDRTDLRNLLLRSLEPGTIKWDHTIKSTRAIDDSTYEVTFAEQPPLQTPILIGADGTFSRIRPLLHETKPTYTGASMYDMLIPAGRMTDRLKSYVGQGCAFIMDDGKMLFPQMNSGGKCKVYAGLHVHEKWLDENPLPDHDKKESIKRLFEGWDERVGELIMACDEDSIVTRRIYAFDPELRWDSALTGVTVIGDAAHVMSPFAGEGVNQALADALDLGRTLVSQYHAPRPRPSLPPFPLSLLPIIPPAPSKPTLRNPTPDAMRKCLRSFEKRMMRRASVEMIESKENLEICFGPEPARRFRNHFYWIVPRAIGSAIVYGPVNFLRSFWSDE